MQHRLQTTLHSQLIQNSSKAAKLSLKLDDQNEIKDVEVVDAIFVNKKRYNYAGDYDQYDGDFTWKDYCSEVGLDYSD